MFIPYILYQVACVKGQYPQHLTKLWECFEQEKGSENDHPEIFDDTQIYVVLELEFCGRDLESFQFQNAEQAYCALLQVSLFHFVHGGKLYPEPSSIIVPYDILLL